VSDKILNPLTESAPCGTDYKYEDAFLAIEAEIDKSNSMLEGVSTDWNEVKKASLDLLENSTKDTKIFCWWAYATWKSDKAAGLQTALNLFNSLLTTYEDKLFPKSKKVKISSLTWLEELLNEEILDERGNVSASINPEEFISLFKELETNFSLTVKDDVAIFRKLRSALERELKAQEVEAKPAPVTTTSPASSSTELGEINSDADAAKVLRSIKKQAGVLHTYYRGQDSFDIRSIRLVRFIAWLDIDELPMDTDGKTPLNPPSELSIDEIESLVAQEKFDEALQSLESLLSLSPFWLEGHFMTFNILTQLTQTKAANEVKNGLITFVKANDKILDLSFKDTTPFASLKLKQWLAESSSEVSVSKNDLDIVDTKAETIEQAYALAKKKKIKEAMGLLQTQYGLAVSNEDKFHWRLAKAEMAAEFGKTDVALALLEDLKRDIDRYNLDEWKPELAARVFSLYLNTFNRTQVDVEHINTAYARLCKIDIKQALEIKI